ncbi:hypothetical protein lerEdw1_016011 [Lerista edwardsae]|nr:hypothetical protein lerEdw1_016011 [Lerista edwardsae]
MILNRIVLLCITFCLGITQHPGEHHWEWTTARPIVQHEPFVVVWNVPTARCQERFGITLPLGDFGIVENNGNVFLGQNMTIFYKNQFGLYPYISPEGEWHYGGIPQNVHLNAHLEKASKEITELLHHNFHGLAVIDWEEWRPLWRRNWGPKNVYRQASERRVWERFPTLSTNEQSYLAEAEFEQAAKVLMERTLNMGKELRPQSFWGFYRFPDCFNDNWEKEDNYTGHCNPAEVQRNNQLMWLWKASSALYPSIYLPPKLPSSHHQRYVHYRLREAFRVAQFGVKQPLPVIAYSRVSYRHSPRYLTESDLVYTIGESAGLGAAGVVLWGDISYSHSPLPPEQPREEEFGSSDAQRGGRRANVSSPSPPTHQISLLFCADTMVKDATSSDRELVELSSHELAEINLHAVESISDLHSASKASGGNSPSQPNTPQTPHGAAFKRFTLPHEGSSSSSPSPEALHASSTFTCCPCFSPTCGPTSFLALLGVLVVASLALATLAVYLSVLQSESLRGLAQILESQERTIQQMRILSSQLWHQLNASGSGAQT